MTAIVGGYQRAIRSALGYQSLTSRSAITDGSSAATSASARVTSSFETPTRNPPVVQSEERRLALPRAEHRQ